MGVTANQMRPEALVDLALDDLTLDDALKVLFGRYHPFEVVEATHRLWNPTPEAQAEYERWVVGEDEVDEAEAEWLRDGGVVA